MANDIVVRQDNGLSAGAFEPQSIDAAMKTCELLVKSGMFGTQAKPEALLVKIMTGRELGLTSMQSIRSLYTFESKGKLIVGVDAAALVACANRHPSVEYFKCVESTDETCTWEIKRRERDKPDRYTYTIAMAKKAGLTDKDVWKAHPAAMLRARCSTSMIRMHIPEAAMSFVNTDEFEEIQSNEREEQPAPQRAHVEQTSAGSTTHPIVVGAIEALESLGADRITYDQAYGIRDDAEAKALTLVPRDAGVMPDVDAVLIRATNAPSLAEFHREMRARTPAFDELRRLLERAPNATEACSAYADHGAHENENESDAAFAKMLLAKRIQRFDELDGKVRTAAIRGEWIRSELASIAALKADAARIEAEREAAK